MRKERIVQVQENPMIQLAWVKENNFFKQDKTVNWWVKSTWWKYCKKMCMTELIKEVVTSRKQWRTHLLRAVKNWRLLVETRSFKDILICISSVKFMQRLIRVFLSTRGHTSCCRLFFKCGPFGCKESLFKICNTNSFLDHQQGIN